MTKREKFIELVDKMIEVMDFSASELDENKDALEFFAGFKCTQVAEKPKFTENGKMILQFMQQNKDKYNNLFKAKDIGEGLGISSKGAAGSIRKLITDGYAEKNGAEPVVYSLTGKGIAESFTEASV